MGERNGDRQRQKDRARKREVGEKERGAADKQIDMLTCNRTE